MAEKDGQAPQAQPQELAPITLTATFDPKQGKLLLELPEDVRDACFLLRLINTSFDQRIARAQAPSSGILHIPPGAMRGLFRS